MMGLEDWAYGWRGLYEKAPAPVRALAGGLYRKLPASWRYGKHYGLFHDEALASESWSIDEIRAYQREQLRNTLTAAAEIPFHRQRLLDAGIDPANVEGPEDLTHLLPVTKSDLIKAGETAFHPAWRGGRALEMSTGGSTGQPLRFLLERHVSRAKEQAYLERQWERAGYRTGMRVAVLRGQITTKGEAGRLWYHDPTRNWLVMSSWHLTKKNLPRYWGKLASFRPEFLHAYPSSARILAEDLDATEHPWMASLRGILCGSEELGLRAKQELEAAFGARVYRWYGHSERAVLAGEGRHSALFHFWPGYGLVEWGAPDAQGFQEIIATSFHNRAAPFLRYRTGDFAEVAAPHTGEFPWPVAEAIVGRGAEFLVGTTGRKVSLTALNRHDDLFRGLAAVQFFQEKRGSVELRYVTRPDFPRSGETVIQRELSGLLGEDFDLVMKEVQEVAKRSNGKAMWITGSLSQEEGETL